MSGVNDLMASTRSGLGSLKIVMATGLYKTAAGVVGARLLKEHASGLRGYLTIQLRNSKAAHQALNGIEEDLEYGSTDWFTQGPSRRAGLFLAAKNIVEYEKLFGDVSTSDVVPWEPMQPGREGAWGRALDELRSGLGPSEAELLELHYVRGLNVDELAYVLSDGKKKVSERLDAGRAYAKLMLEDIFEDELPEFDELLPEAFAVLPPAPDEVASAKTAVVPLPAGTVIGERYEVQSRLGGGEFAYVYRARDIRVPGHVVALKLLHRVARSPAAREGAIRELSLIASAFHPSLVQFKEHGWFEDRLWFVMPFYEGELLLHRLERSPLPLTDALDYFERLARALAALHAAGIRHQDIKPENIFLVEMGSGEHTEHFPVLLDLGVASPNGEMALAGTPMYFPPEIAARLFEEHCDLPVTPKADVFALALSLLHSIEAPELEGLANLNVDEFLKKRVHLVPAGPKSPELAELVPYFVRWLARDPNERPTAGAMADELKAFRNALSMQGMTKRMPLWRWGVGMLGAALLGGFCALALQQPMPSGEANLHPGDPSTLPAATLAGEVEIPGDESHQTGTEEVAPSDASPDDSSQEDSADVRLLRHRLDVERGRSAALEDELSRLRRNELGLERTRSAEVNDAEVEASESSD